MSFFKRGSLFFTTLFLVIAFAPAEAQKIESMGFEDRPITDILLALAEFSGKSIIPDETVSGRASYYFADTDFETALKVFLSTYKLYLEVRESVYYVSRVRAAYNADSNKLSVDAEDADIHSVINFASRALGKTVLYDALPPGRITLHTKDISPESFLNLLVKKLKGFELETSADFYYIKEQASPAAETRARVQGPIFTIENNLFSIDQKKGRCSKSWTNSFRKPARSTRSLQSATLF